MAKKYIITLLIISYPCMVLAWEVIFKTMLGEPIYLVDKAQLMQLIIGG